MGLKHGNVTDAQVEKSGSPPAILGVRMPGLPLNLYTENHLCRFLVNNLEHCFCFNKGKYNRFAEKDTMPHHNMTISYKLNKEKH